nr:iron chelate uptake ABC transporter family permease subunit [Williamsia deligens]
MRVRSRTVVVVAVLGVLAVVSAVFALGVGEYRVDPATVVSVLTGQNTGFDSVVVLEWRMPRILLALVIGAVLGISGAIFQALTRNPLGSPDIIGFGIGAYTGALIALAAFGGGYYLMAGGAIVGGLVAAVAVYALAYRSGVAGFRLIVVGIAVSAVLNSINQWIVIKIDLKQAITASVWSQGTLSGVEWAQLVPVAVCSAVAIAAVCALGRQLGVLQMGDDAAGALGVRVERVRLAYLVVGVVLVAVATAAAGPISFVALAAPQLARRLSGAAGVGLVGSAAMGAVLLLVSDLVAQTVFAPTQLPVGAVTVCVGGVYLVYLLVTQVRKGRG